MSLKGYNPLRWDCKEKGCFNEERRPKIEVFHSCFPRKINFGDVDGIVEINGKALLLEWKTGSGTIPLGQKIMYNRLTKAGHLTVICVVGNAKTMECEKYCLFFDGKQTKWKNAELDYIKKVIKRWAKYAQSP